MFQVWGSSRSVSTMSSETASMRNHRHGLRDSLTMLCPCSHFTINQTHGREYSKSLLYLLLPHQLSFQIMLSVTRSPLTSPALRTMASASSYIATPSSPLSYPPSSSLPHTRLPPSMGIPREPYPNTPGKPVYGSYFNFVGASTTPSRFNGPCSPACGSLTPVPVSPSFPSILLSRGFSSNAVKQLGHVSGEAK